MNIKIRFGKRDDILIHRVNELRIKYPHVNITIESNQENINLKDVEVFVTTKISLAELETCNKLKVLILPMTGVNQLPLSLFESKGIKVINSHVNARYVAEKAIALALALLGRVVELDQNLREGNWRGTSWTSLHHLTIGMIGMGEIGLHILNHLLPFDCKINTLERYRNKNLNVNITYLKDVEEVCLSSDLIFVSLPLTKETHHIINSHILSQMKDKYIINVGRGDVIDEKALFDVLDQRVLKGAALDVWYQYPNQGKNTLPSKYPFHELKHVVLSPHSGSDVNKCLDEEVDGFIKKIESYINGHELVNTVEYKREY